MNIFSRMLTCSFEYGKIRLGENPNKFNKEDRYEKSSSESHSFHVSFAGILLFLPTFSLWAVEAPAAEEQGTVPEGVTVVSEDESK